MTELADRLEEVRGRDAASPCGSFTFAYHCMCDYHGVTFSEEVAWVRTVNILFRLYRITTLDTAIFFRLVTT